MHKKLKMAVACLPLLLSACAAPKPAPELGTVAPVQWHGPLPHAGKTENLARWWQHQGDPLLAQLIEAAQGASPSLASARARIEEARAARVAAGAALLPTLAASASVSSSSAQPPLTM